MKKQVTLCDKCKNRVADKRCYFCGDDICNTCSNTLTVIVEWEKFGKLKEEKNRERACAGCRKKLNTLSDRDNKMSDAKLKKMTLIVLEYVKKELIAERL